jgi:outer membrane lipoprotein carrier protein
MASAQSGTPAEARPGTDLLRTVQSTYNALESLRATFTQTVVSPFADDSTQIRGILLLQGNQYRVETPRETFVTDGTTTWVYTPADSQVVVNRAAQDPAAVSPQTLLMDYTDRYAVERSRTASYKGTSHRVLHLAPTADAARFESLRLWIRPTDALVTRLRVVDASGAVIRITFRDLVRNPAVQASDFTFDPPPGVEVVDLRSS